jgi:hypothetical protein
MTRIPPSVSRVVLAGLSAFHILIIIASNYLVQLPITLFGWHTTWGAFSFPFIFLATDLTVRLIGKRSARVVIARVMLPALVASYVVSVLFHEGPSVAWRRWVRSICWSSALPSPASSLMPLASCWIFRCLSACALYANGGLRPRPRPFSATCWIPLCSSRWPSGAVMTPLWRPTEWKSPRWIS